MATLKACGPHRIVNCSVCFPKPPNDKSKEETQRLIDDAVGRGWTTHVKITCEKCGKRVVVSVPNTIVDEYAHEECGHLNHPKGYGLFLIIDMPKKGGPNEVR